MTSDEIKIRKAYFELLRWVADESLHLGRNKKAQSRIVAGVERHMKTARETLPGFDYTRILDSFTVWIEKPGRQ